MTDFIESKVLQQGSPGWMSMENPQHFLTSIRQQFLSVSRVRNRLPLLSITVCGQVNEKINKGKAIDVTLA